MLAKALIAIPTLWFGIVPPIIDYSQSHVLNPGWPPHARFHMVWLLVSNLLISASALFLLFKHIPRVPGTRIAGLISLCVYLGFFTSAITMNAYGGSLSDANAVPEILGIDANLFVFTPLTIMLIAGIYLSFSARAKAEGPD